ncbi:MAG: hypothetical protein KF796_20605 [Ramlibacter sp.]|nr:hypothetical protein [Ramlibacter sp.]
MSHMQWLLIGGPAHGQTLRVKGGSQIRYRHSDAEEYLYCARTFRHQGREYRLGVCYSDSKRYSDDMIATLVERSGVQSLGAA